MTYILEVEHLPEIVVPGHRLGRHVLHDERSKAYAVTARSASTLRTVQHVRHVPVFDQGNLGSCTGNAAVGALGTGPLFDAVTDLHVPFGETLAVSVYSAATVIDGFAGTYKPDDTGSDGLSVSKVLQSDGYISGYQHALSLDAALTALQDGPVITGVGWHEGFDQPDSKGLVKLTGQKRGGHEFVVDGMDVERQLVWATNSWGSGWGVKGRFCFSWSDWDALLKDDGDVTVLVPLTSPAPVPTPVPVKDADAALAAAAHKWLKGFPIFYKPMQKATKTWLDAKGL